MDSQSTKEDTTNTNTSTLTNNTGQKLLVIKKSKLQKIDKLVFRYLLKLLLPMYYQYKLFLIAINNQTLPKQTKNS